MRTIGTLMLAAWLITFPADAQVSNEIMDVDRAFNTMAQTAGIAAAFDRYLAPDAVKLDNGSHPVIGHDAAVDSMQGGPEGATLVWAPEDGKVAASGDLAYTWGTYVYTFSQNGERKELHGKYFTIWAKRDGEWKAIVDGGNASPGPWRR